MLELIKNVFCFEGHSWAFDKFHYAGFHVALYIAVFGNPDNTNTQPGEMHLSVLKKKIAGIINNRDMYKIMVRHYDLMAYVQRCGKHHLSPDEIREVLQMRHKKRTKEAACDMGVRTPLMFMAINHESLQHTATCLGKNGVYRKAFSLMAILAETYHQVCIAKLCYVFGRTYGYTI
jgi:hypothetical protein